MKSDADSAIELAQLEAQGAFKPDSPAARDAHAHELYAHDTQLREVFIAAWNACEEVP